VVETTTAATTPTGAARTNPIAGLLHGVASIFGLDRPTAPSNPIGAFFWGVLQQVASALRVAPRPGSATSSTPVVTTGLVTGDLGFTDPAGGTLSYTLISGPDNGELTFDEAAGTYSYTPSLDARLAAAGGTGPLTDSFRVRAFNGIASTTKVVNVAISPDTPVAGVPTVGAPDVVTGAISGGVTFSDPASQPLTYSVSTGPSKGTITEFDSSTGEFTYTPSTDAQLGAEAAGAVGADTFVISASNGAASTTVTVTVAVDPGTPQSAAPVVDTSDPSGAVTGTAVFTDPAGGQLTYSITTGPSEGSISEFDDSTGEFTYVPNEDSAAVSDAFVVTASNGVHTATQTISVPVNTTDAFVGVWNVTSITTSALDGSSSVTIPVPSDVFPDPLHIPVTRSGSEYNVLIGTVTKTGPRSYSAALPEDQIAARKQQRLDFLAATGQTATDYELSITFTVEVSEDGQTMTMSQVIIERFNLVTGDTVTPYDGSGRQTFNATKISDTVSV
jgi:hypothetical protein